jgi:membrane-associated protease RseP (regulator of RpoE activity)
MTNFFLEHWDVIAFYTLVVLLLYLFRSKFEFQGIVALLKTKLGVKFMTETGQRHPRFWHVVGLISIIIGFIGMLFITAYLFYGLYALFFVPNAPPTLSPVVPGVKIPGVPFTFPLWYTLIGLFFAVIIHEAAHGVFSAAYNIKIKSSGFAFFGPLPGAFVEPDEKVLLKRPKRQQLAIFSAGPFANVVLALLTIILAAGVGALTLTLVNQNGVTISGVQEGSGAALAGIPANVTITRIDAAEIHNTVELSQALAAHEPGDTVRVQTIGKSYRVTLTESPQTPGKAYIGVLGVQTATELKNPSMGWLFTTLLIITSMFTWTYIISLGIGIANLLPIGPIDGGRMFLIALQAKFPKKRAEKIWTRWSIAMIGIVLILVLTPIIRAIL